MGCTGLDPPLKGGPGRFDVPPGRAALAAGAGVRVTAGVLKPPLTALGVPPNTARAQNAVPTPPLPRQTRPFSFC